MLESGLFSSQKGWKPEFSDGFLDSEIVQAIQQATKQKDKASAVHMALNEYLRLQKLRQLADLAGTVELRYSNDELEAM